MNSTSRQARAALTLVLLLGACMLGAQNAPASPASPAAPAVPASPAVPGAPSAPAVAPVSSAEAPRTTGSSQAGFQGSWTVERSIYDFITTLKDVSDAEGSYYAKILFGAQGKGKIWYNGKADPIDMEYDMKEQGLTIAYGSRLKPQTDLFQVLSLNDGKMFLKSRRLGTMNGTMFYLLTKE